MRRLSLIAAVAVVMILGSAVPAVASETETIRLAGPDRYATAVAVSQHHHPDGATVVYVASGADFPDGLTGSAAAGHAGGPLLLTRPDVLPQVTSDEIARLQPDHIYLLGGIDAVDNTVFMELTVIAQTTRIAGPNRYATAAAISAHSFPSPGSASAVVVATGVDFADALTGAALAVPFDAPVLLTRPGDLPQVTRAEILRLAPDDIYLLGGTAAVSQAVQDELSSLAATTRIAGLDRYATAAAVSEFGFADASTVLVATGAVFADALAGGAAAGGVGAPILLSRPAGVPEVIADELFRLDPDTALLLGGTAALSADIEVQVAHAASSMLVDLTLTLDEVAAGFTRPLFVAHRPGDDRLFVVEQPGRVHSMNAGGGDRVEVLDITAVVRDEATEQGLLGLAFDPGDPSRMIVSYTAEPDGRSRIEEYSFPLAAATAVGTPVRTILEVPQFAGNHNGGMIAFGPDGHLYIALGDGGGSGDPQKHGQDPDTLLGSILRIDLAGDPYAIPADNPFADGSGGAPEVWAYGLRNPWRFSFDGDSIYIADVGQGRREEVNLLDTASGGANLGWSVMEGTLCFDGPQSLCEDNDFVDPIHEYSIQSVPRCAITGGYVYRGADFPGLRGAYLFGDYCTGEVMALRTLGGKVAEHRVFPVSAPLLSSFGVGPDGTVYLTRRGAGTILRVVVSDG